MEFNFGNSRPRATQQVIQFNRFAPGAESNTPAIQLSETHDESWLITTFLVSNYPDNTATVFLGADQGMHASIAIPPGASPQFATWQEGRQLYELQILIMKLSQQEATDLIQVPVIVWDLRNWWISAEGSEPVEIAVTAFPLPYL